MSNRIVWIATCAWATAAFGQGVPGMAVGILEQSKLARQAIAAHDQPGALDHVRQANALAAQIQQQSPDAQSPILVAVSQDVETTTTYTPVKHRKNEEMNPKRMKHNTSIRDVDREVSTTQLNVTAAAAQLEQAQAALQQGNLAQADAALVHVSESVVEGRATGDAPLAKVRENLQLARARIQENHPKRAEVPLRSAAEALGEYEKMTARPAAGKAAALRAQVEDLQRNIGHESQNADERIQGWLEQIDSWPGTVQ